MGIPWGRSRTTSLEKEKAQEGFDLKVALPFLSLYMYAFSSLGKYLVRDMVVLTMGNGCCCRYGFTVVYIYTYKMTYKTKSELCNQRKKFIVVLVRYLYLKKLFLVLLV